MGWYKGVVVHSGETIAISSSLLQPQLPFSHCIDIGYGRGRRQLDLRFYFRRMIGRSYVG